MPPRRQRSVTPSDPRKAPTRRSARVAAQETSAPPSRASSVVPDGQKDGLSLDFILRQVLGGNFKVLKALTSSQKDATILNLVERSDNLEYERDSAKAELARVREFHSNPLKKHMMKERLAALAPPAQSPPAQSPPAQSPPAQSPPTITETRDTDDTLGFSISNLSTGTPATFDRAPHQQQTPKGNATPRASFLGVSSFFKRIASPFISRTTPQEETITQQQQQPTKQTLGELPASRKRPAPVEEEPETYTQPQTPATSTSAPEQQPESEQQPDLERQTTTQITPRNSAAPNTRKIARAHTVPSSKNPQQETSLATITEHTETNDSTMVDPTPTRKRTIANVRRGQTPSRRATTPSRYGALPLPPREPNADRRIDKVRTYSKLKEELRSMEQDPELQQLIGGRPLKRVKVDKLIKIPHNKPGESSGTFAVPDIDSDDEMEVDADEETRSNIFDTLPAESTPAPAVQAAPRRETQVNADEETRSNIFDTLPAESTPASAVQAAPRREPQAVTSPVPATKAPAIQAPPESVVTAPVAEIAETPPMVWKFPELEKNPDGKLNRMDNAYAGAKFAYGFEHWKATGEVLDLF